MIDGFWTVQFHVPERGDIGQGVAVFQNGKVYGGDNANTYTGDYTLDGTALRFTLRISPYGKPKGPSIFGTYGRFNLELEGQAAANAFRVTGTSPEFLDVYVKKVRNL